MELMQIRYFLEVANTKHMTNSAKNLHITQPALTQAIRRLENDLGVPLFTAKGRNIVLTEYGKYLQKKLEPLMSQIDDIPEQLKMMVELESETIHMNVLAASSLVMEAIIQYKKEHGDINFQLHQNVESELYDIAVTTKLFYQASDEENSLPVQKKFIWLCRKIKNIGIGHPSVLRKWKKRDLSVFLAPGNSVISAIVFASMRDLRRGLFLKAIIHPQ